MKSELSMTDFCGSQISFISFFGCIVCAYILSAVSESDSGSPCRRPFIEFDPSEAGYANVSKRICSVLTPSSFT